MLTLESSQGSGIAILPPFPKEAGQARYLTSQGIMAHCVRSWKFCCFFFFYFLFSTGEELINNAVRDFPGPVANTLSSQCRGAGFEPRVRKLDPTRRNYNPAQPKKQKRNNAVRVSRGQPRGSATQAHAPILPQATLPAWPGSPSRAPCSGPDKPQLYQEPSKRSPPHEQEGGGKLLISDSKWRTDSARPPLSPPDSSP